MLEKTVFLSCDYPDEASLYLAYMPFIQGGGLFIKTTEVYTIEQPVELTIQIWKEPESFIVPGKISWITPKGTQGNKPPGIGVQFLGDEGKNLSDKIEIYLADVLKSTQATHTL